MDWEKEIKASYAKVFAEAREGRGDEAAMDEMDRLFRLVRDAEKARKSENG